MKASSISNNNNLSVKDINLQSYDHKKKMNNLTTPY